MFVEGIVCAEKWSAVKTRHMSLKLSVSLIGEIKNIHQHPLRGCVPNNDWYRGTETNRAGVFSQGALGLQGKQMPG